ncbi:hypothetical protein BC829DRAFT_441148 [Chytridium lagenaria]|nr:hypothetical protein BC829DRAFT_441148 [Chytridium lagenaria]
MDHLIDDFPVSSKQVSRVIDGTPTEIIATDFANVLFIAITQVGALGPDAYIRFTLQVKTLLGQREDPILNIYASQILLEVLSSNPREERKLLLGLGLKKELRDWDVEHEGNDPVMMRKRFLEGVVEGLAELGIVKTKVAGDGEISTEGM